MIVLKKISCLLVLVLMLVACETHVQENDVVEVEQDDNCDPETSFITSIKPIIDNNCLPCHRAQLPILTSFENIRDNRDDIRTQVVVLRRMPLGGSLSSDEIALIRCWIDNGAQNN